MPSVIPLTFSRRRPAHAPRTRGRASRPTRRLSPAPAAIALATAALATAALALAACTRAGEPVRDSREALGTIVTVAAYADRADDARAATDNAFERMAEVEAMLDARETSSAIGAFNREPYQPQSLPPDAIGIADRVRNLRVEEWFSPSLLGVLGLYRFETQGRVPARDELASATALSATFGPRGDGRWAFRRPEAPPPAPPGLDFGGAAKGLALDRAAAAMRSDGVPAALITATSTTLTYGRKPDGEPWRVGIEDPRKADATVATIEAAGSVAISTSGDYQRFFMRNGTRYHHIIDPNTGEPARGLRSLTVLGKMSALDSDILSTALFVAGRKAAEDYARERDLGLVTVDDEGRVRLIQPGDGSARISTDGD